jgi:hypothetical protein
MPSQPLLEEAVSIHTRTQEGTVWVATRVMREKKHTRTCIMMRIALLVLNITQ